MENPKANEGLKLSSHPVFAKSRRVPLVSSTFSMASLSETHPQWSPFHFGHGRVPPLLPPPFLGGNFENALFNHLVGSVGLSFKDQDIMGGSHGQSQDSSALFFSNIMKKMAEKYQHEPDMSSVGRSFDPFVMESLLHDEPTHLQLSRSPPPPAPHHQPLGESLLCSQPLDLSPSASPGLETDIARWSVYEVAQFVASIDSCQTYAQIFGEHSIDGSILILLGEAHLTQTLGMKLGPAMQLLKQIRKHMAL